MDTKAAAAERLESALEHVEQAQRELEHAAQELSAIAGGLKLWDKVSKESLRVDSLWHWLRDQIEAGALANRFDLDDLHKAKLQPVAVAQPEVTRG